MISNVVMPISKNTIAQAPPPLPMLGHLPTFYYAHLIHLL